MKKIFILVIVLLITGCTNYKELNNLAIVNMIGIDYVHGHYNISMQSINTSKNIEDNQKEINSEGIYESVGNNISDAINNITTKNPKKIYLEHLDIVIISEALAKNGIEKIIDYFIRNNSINKNFTLVIARNNIPINILNSIKSDANFPIGNILGSIESSSTISGNTTNIKFTKFVSDYYMEGINPVAISININNDKPAIDSLALFNKNKLVGYLNKEENVGYNFITNRIDNTLITFKCNNDNFNSVNITDSKTTMRNNFKDNTINLDIDLVGTIEELNCKMDIDKIKKMSINKIDKIINNTIFNIKNKYNLDIFGFGEFIYKNNNKYYKKYKNNYLKNLNIKTNINLELNDIDTSIKIGGLSNEKIINK